MGARATARLRGEDGFTLIELVIAMPIMLIVVGGMTLMLTTLTHFGSRNQEELTLQTEARSALNRMETEIRGAFYGDGATAAISSATATGITFYTPDEYASTVAGSTLSTFHLRQVSYRVQNGLLQRQYQTSTNTYPTAPPWSFPGTMSGWQTVVGSSGSITNTDVFSYWDQCNCQGSPCTTPSTPHALTFPISSSDLTSIACVVVKLTLSTIGGSGAQPEHFTVTDTIAVRGFGT
jgi:type II secretory pathway component PulJ